MTRNTDKAHTATIAERKRAGMCARLSCDIDAPLHHRLRVAAVTNKMTLQVAVEEAIRRFLPELEKGGSRS